MSLHINKGAVPLIERVVDWYCPNCGATDQVKGPTASMPHTRFHTCPKLRFLTAPMLPAGTKAKVTLHEREDYVHLNGHDELVQLDPERGRPVMKVVTERDEGTDCVVFAPTAYAEIG